MRNLSLMTDLYELTMMNGYSALGSAEKTAAFYLFFLQQGEITLPVAAGYGQPIVITYTILL